MNGRKFKRINMGFNYKLAEIIIGCFNSDDISNQLDCLVHIDAKDDDELIREIFSDGKGSLTKPSKRTLLHCFIESYLYYYIMNERYYLLDELCDDMEIDLVIEYIGDTEKILKEYGISVFDYDAKIRKFYEVYEQADEETQEEMYKEYKEYIRTIYDAVISNFNRIENDIVEATFYLLYNNKGFLFNFNKYLSKYITKDYLPNDFFNEHNHIKRSGYLPEWLKRAVFYRDNGRCQHCGTDLTGSIVINNDKELQYDHIIPLEQGGTNDATNFQILCSNCNLEKSGNLVQPDYYYQMYW